jgi:transposase
MTVDELKLLLAESKRVFEQITDNENAIKLLIDETGEARRKYGNRADMSQIELAAMKFADRLAPLLEKRAELEARQTAIMALVNPLASAIINSGINRADLVYTAVDLCYVHGLSASQAGLELGFSQREIQRFNAKGLNIMLECLKGGTK